MNTQVLSLVLALGLLSGGAQVAKASDLSSTIRCQHTLTFHLKGSERGLRRSNETFEVSLEAIREAQENFENGRARMPLGHSFLAMEPKFGGPLSEMSRYHWEIGYYFKVTERSGRTFVEVSASTLKTGHRKDFDLGMAIPAERNQSAVLTWKEKTRRYTPEYTLECEMK